MNKNTSFEKNTKTAHPEARGLLLLAFTLIVLLSLISFRFDAPHRNWLGLIGWGLGFGFNYLFGLSSYLIVSFGLWLGWKLILNQKPIYVLSKFFCLLLLCFSFCFLFNLLAENKWAYAKFFENRVYTESHFFELPYPYSTVRYNLGGVPFYYLYKDIPTFNLQHMLSDVGIILTFSITACVSFLFLMEIELLAIARKLKQAMTFFKNKIPKIISQKKALPIVKSASEIESLLSQRSITPPYLQTKHKEISEKEIKIRTMADTEPVKKKEPIEAKVNKRQIALNAQRVVNGDYTTYQIPPASLLNHPKKVDQPLLKKELKKQAEVLQDTLMSFGIEAKVGEINCGPTITSFEVHPAIGVKVQRIKTLENDIALNLQAKSIRIIAPIPGKAAVGVEVPSIYPQEVSFKELLTQYQGHTRKMMVPILLGKTVSGDSVISDLSKMPHCLIAGATGSGKSVCVNTLIMSILMNARPDEIKLVMIDPKKVELTPYTNLPHMLAPVITEPHGAYAALSWLVKEMQTRYEILKQLGVRNITAFNNRQINQELESSLNLPIPTKMYAIVAIIDEFADLMMASSSDLETPIARIAQMARAVGIHLILATQRPSREVITGLIKANFPTRIAFKVASRINSQIILDDVGAESLLGNGDMLFLPPGTSTLIRSQGVYISDEEINRVVSFICNQSPPNYLIESFDKMRFEDLSSEEGAENAPRDLLYEQALSLVIDTGTASTTFLQRKLKIGYARAASLMDELEGKKVISSQEGAKPRRVLLDPKEISLLKPNKANDTE